MSDTKLKAITIFDAVMETDTDDRGLLFKDVAGLLRMEGQGYTASQFDLMAERYGYEGQKERLASDD